METTCDIGLLDSNRHAILAKIVAISKAAKNAAEQSAEADRMCNELSGIVDKARHHATSVRQLAEGIAETAAAVARMALESCRYHSYREALESAAQAGLLRPESPQSFTDVEELDLTEFLRLLAGGTGDGQTASPAALILCRGGNVAQSPVSKGCPIEANPLTETAASCDQGGETGGTSNCGNCDGKAQLIGTTATGCGYPIGFGGDDVSSGCGQKRSHTAAKYRTLASMHSTSLPVIQLYSGSKQQISDSALINYVTDRDVTRTVRTTGNINNNDECGTGSSTSVHKGTLNRQRSDNFSVCQSNGVECPSRESFSSDSDADELLNHHHGWHRRTTPAINKIRTLESLSTDSLDPDSVHDENYQRQAALIGLVRADTCTNPHRRLSRPRDRTIQRRSYSPLLNSSERNLYTVLNMNDDGRLTNTAKHIFIPLTRTTSNYSNIQSASDCSQEHGASDPRTGHLEPIDAQEQ